MGVYPFHYFRMIKINRILLVIAALFINGCVSLSVGEKLSKRIINKPNDANKAETSVYALDSSTMMAINHILPTKMGQFEMMNKTIIFPAFKRNDIEVYKFHVMYIPCKIKVYQPGIYVYISIYINLKMRLYFCENSFQYFRPKLKLNALRIYLSPLKAGFIYKP